jgi:hypothetical protein
MLVKIIGEGFLSGTGQKEAQRLITCHPGVFHSLESTIATFRFFASSLEVLEQECDADRQKIIALVLAVRLLEISEAALLIMKNGMSNEANTMFRVFLDAYFVFANVCNDASFVINYFKSDEAARFKMLNSVKKHDSELFKKVNDYASESLKSELKKRILEENIQAFNSYAYADNVGCSEIYDSMYRLTSASLHTMPRSLEKYVEEDESGIIVAINDFPLEGDIPQRCYDFSFFLIRSLSGLKDVFGCFNAEEIESMTCNLNESCRPE